MTAFTRTPTVSFSPTGILRNPHVQSVLSGVPPRSTQVRLLGRSLERSSSAAVLDCGRGVRLQGFFTPQAVEGRSKGLVLILHGWEGSARSIYVLSLARHLWSCGHAVFRLDFRDHGGSHHLNTGVFHSCRLDEVVGAAAAIVRRFPVRPFHVVGFSLGGNFALRLGLRAPREGLPIARVVAVSPAIDPAHVLDALETGPRFYERHFIRKWRRSLRSKQRLFPHLYDFRKWSGLDSLREQTRHLVLQYTGFASLDDYLLGYSVAGSRLAGLRVPSTIVTSEDDPVVPIADVRRLVRPACLTVETRRYGGHCGFLANLTLRSWIDTRIASILDSSRNRD